MTKHVLLAISISVVLAVATAATTACNTGTGACPSAGGVVPGGACSENELQCGYTLSTPNAACDGTSSTYQTSCTCTNGTWSCPDPIVCEAGAPTDEGGG